MNEEQKNLLFGKIAIKLGYASEDDINRVLVSQETDSVVGQKKHIGTYLFEEGILTKEQIQQVIQFQKRYIEKHAQNLNTDISTTTLPKQSAEKTEAVETESVPSMQDGLTAKTAQSLNKECNKKIIDNHNTCPNCDKQYNDYIPACDICGYKFTNIKRSDYSGTLLAIPIISSLLLFFWVRSMPLTDDPGKYLSFIAYGSIILTAVIAYIEIKPYTKDSIKWLLYFLLLWLLAYPAYFYERRKHGFKSHFCLGILVAALFTYTLFSVGMYFNNVVINLFNKSEVNIEKNGNAVVAFEKISKKTSDEIWKLAQFTNIEELCKSPSEYIGKILKIDGKVYRVDTQENGLSDVMILVDSPNSPLKAVNVDFVYNGNAIDITVDSVITCAGYFIGTYSSESPSGATLEVLAIMGNSIKQ